MLMFGRCIQAAALVVHMHQGHVAFVGPPSAHSQWQHEQHEELLQQQGQGQQQNLERSEQQQQQQAVLSSANKLGKAASPGEGGGGAAEWAGRGLLATGWCEEGTGGIGGGSVLGMEPDEEERASGVVSSATYAYYATAVGWGVAAVVVASLLAMQVSACLHVRSCA